MHTSRALSLILMVALAAIVSAHPDSYVRHEAPYQHRRHHQRNLTRMEKRYSPRAEAPSSSLEEPAPSANGGEDTLASDDINALATSQQLFPVSGYSQSWTTSPFLSGALALSDATFRPHHAIGALPRNYVSAPDGRRSLRAYFPQGSVTYNEPLGGISFYAPGPSSVDITRAKEATFSYSVYFESGFAFNKGGKLPGLYGGNSENESVSCSGGRRTSTCFSARFMWRRDGAGEFYTYLPPYDDPRFAANSVQCNVPPYSECNPTYGASVGRGAFTFPTGRWIAIAERVRLNDVGQANGRLELFIDGRSVINVNGLILRDSSAGRIRGIQMQTFFGGSDSTWASPKNQNIYFSEFSVAITQYL